MSNNMSNTITFNDFQKLELRVGRVTAARAPDWSRKLLKLSVSFGPELGERTILAGVKGHYQPQDFIDNNYLFVVNLAEKTMGQGTSQGMMLMADDEGQPIKFELPSQLSPGTLVR
jgi:methionyl-tRNA synthetase